MNINFSGYNENVVTFEIADSDIVMGTPVKMSSSATVMKCNDGDNMIGVAVNVRNGYAAVQLTGYIEMPTEETISVGYQTLSVNEKGKVEVNSSGREYLVTYVEQGIVGFIL
ncbi:MAG: hypothetical protein E7513_06005 [Ruminococcaceae bacterium]|nr:hypothetical protein [Oscillospiraceae bacterium]